MKRRTLVLAMGATTLGAALAGPRALGQAAKEPRRGKDIHRNFVHPKVAKPIAISGALGDDAKHYQVRAVKRR